MSRAKARADRIRKEIPLDEILVQYGYAVIPNADREQQFACDLHGDGSDGKPSARFYPDSTSWHCFACSKSRDAISTVMEKEGKNFSEACSDLERRYNLPPLPWSDEKPKRVDTEIKTQKEVSVEDYSKSLLKSLKSFGRGNDIPLSKLLKMWEVHDMLMYYYREGKIEQNKVLKGFHKIHQSAFTVAREGL